MQDSPLIIGSRTFQSRLLVGTGKYKDLNETADLLVMAESENEAELLLELDHKIEELEQEFKDLEFYSLLSGPYDNGPAIVSIHAGTGGVDGSREIDRWPPAGAPRAGGRLPARSRGPRPGVRPTLGQGRRNPPDLQKCRRWTRRPRRTDHRL